MAAGQLTSVQAHARLHRPDRRGQRARARAERRPHRQPARAARTRRCSTSSAPPASVRGPLHGIPVLVKDNLDVAGLPTTAGNVALQNSIPDRDSTVVAKLRAAGAVILGKTNLTEFANFMTNGMPNGYSLARRPGAQPVRHRPRHERLALRLRLRGRRRPRGDHDRHRDLAARSSARPPQQGIVGLRPTVGLVSPRRHPADLAPRRTPPAR